jgi:queuine tRNA-ribosyltransferase
MMLEILARDGAARRGRLHLRGGFTVETPAFMPVATRGTAIALSMADLEELGFEMILANAWHLSLRPGAETLRRMGGIHRFTGWQKPVLTDSGGFQIYSLASFAKVDEDGVGIRSPWDGSARRLTPESVVALQAEIGSDVWMPLDHCPPGACGEAEARDAMERTLRWAARAKKAWSDLSPSFPLPCERGGGGKARGEGKSALFGIVQGGVFEDLRRECARALADMDFPGYAVGGLSVGEDKRAMWPALEAALEALPAAKPRYFMGVGSPADLVESVARGVDLFDCVYPTRNARNGTLYTFRGPLNVKHSRFAHDENPPEPDCPCLACRAHSLAYLRHLWRASEPAALRLMSLHNLAFYHALMGRMRGAIEAGRFEAWRREFYEGFGGEGERRANLVPAGEGG